jgi:MATE family multidrug resistance protein
MAAAGLAISFTNVFGVSIGYGLATAYDTLGAQANGSGDYSLVGVLAQRTACILALLLLPVWAMWINAEGILLGCAHNFKVFNVIFLTRFARAVGQLFLLLEGQHL